MCYILPQWRDWYIHTWYKHQKGVLTWFSMNTQDGLLFILLKVFNGLSICPLLGEVDSCLFPTHSYQFVDWTRFADTIPCLINCCAIRAPAFVVSILLYRCTTWTLTKRLEKKLDGIYTRMLRAILNKPWRQHPTKLQLYGHQPPITKTNKIRRTRHAGHYWRSRDELISDVLLWNLSHGRVNTGIVAWTYI